MVNRYVVVIILIVVLLGGVMFSQFSFGTKYVEFADNPDIVAPPSEEVSNGGELLGLSASQEEAEQTAALYGITLVSFNNTIAVYTTDKDPNEVIHLGEKEGYPPLSINYLRHID